MMSEFLFCSVLDDLFFFFIFLVNYLIEVELIYNAVPTCAVQQSDSVIHR